ncbi:hypothetical protein [Hymenobacter rubripertinctus]|uniref:hypothetical protein n=1 Tax=Hymenobacter rubripertinctus TaxID=2029981 RepID=UPI0011C38AB7|nr:hypothetical protein [Hymenobacter rubripertinctus]
MPNLIANHTGQAFTSRTIDQALLKFKTDIENAIKNRGEEGKNELIRSQGPIKLIHDAVKTEFMRIGVHPSLINPELEALQRCATGPGQAGLFTTPAVLKDKELALTGLLKTKNQDVCIVPRNITVASEVLQYNTYVFGQTDPYGLSFTEQVISVNVRSQLSSISKNFDTLYERTFAEALNFHLRAGNMVLGEVYMIIAKPYDPKTTKLKQIGFEAPKKKSVHIDKYIRSFQALNDRTSMSGDHHKYERVALLVVDFEPSVPKLYNTTAELIADGFLEPNSTVNLGALSFGSFAADMMSVYQSRFPNNRFS